MVTDKITECSQTIKDDSKPLSSLYTRKYGNIMKRNEIWLAKVVDNEFDQLQSRRDLTLNQRITDRRYLSSQFDNNER